jgi:hypothetical protein
VPESISSHQEALPMRKLSVVTVVGTEAWRGKG